MRCCSHSYRFQVLLLPTLFVVLVCGNDKEIANELEEKSISRVIGDTDTVLLPDNIPLNLVWISAGSYNRGAHANELDHLENELPQHQVTLIKGFWMGRYVVTKAQWEAVMGTTPWEDQRFVLDDPNSPAVYVSWDDAQVFIDKLNALTGREFRFHRGRMEICRTCWRQHILLGDKTTLQCLIMHGLRIMHGKRVNIMPIL